VEARHPQLWRSLPDSMRQDALDDIERELPTISRRAFHKIGENIDQLLDIKLMAVSYMRREPEVLKEILMGMAAPELRFMVRVGALGFVFGIPLALYLSLMHYTGPEAVARGGTVVPMPEWAVSVLHLVPAWVTVLAGAALIGVLVNIIAVKVVFEPGEPQPRYKYPWKQSKVARRPPARGRRRSGTPDGAAGADGGELRTRTALRCQRRQDAPPHRTGGG
jgi:hypothetical protein